MRSAEFGMRNDGTGEPLKRGNRDMVKRGHGERG